MIICGTKRQLLDRLRERGSSWTDVTPAITSSGSNVVCVDVDHPAYPRRRIGPWPRRIRMIARFRRPGERGVGDTLERLYGRFGREYKIMHRRVFGTSCGCEAERDRLNRTYPYQTAAPAPPPADAPRE